MSAWNSETPVPRPIEDDDTTRPSGAIAWLALAFLILSGIWVLGLVVGWWSV